MIEPSDVLRDGAGPADAAELLLPADAEDYDVADAVESVLKASPDVESVTVWLGTRIGGHVLREDFANADPDTGTTMGIGDGDGAELPGFAHLIPLTVTCPHCGTAYLVLSFDAADPPRCRADATALTLVQVSG